MGWLFALVSLFIGYVVARVVLFVVRLQADLRVLNRMPHPPMGKLGFLDIMRDKDHMAQSFTRLADELGSIFYVRALHVPIVVVSDPALWQQALSVGIDLEKAPSVYGLIAMLTSPGGRQQNLLGHPTHDGYWKLVRKGVAPAFSPKNIRAEFPHVLELTEQLSAILSSVGAQYIDVDNLLQRESLDVIGRIGFGTTFGAIQAFQMSPQQQQGPRAQAASSRSHGGGLAPLEAAAGLRGAGARKGAAPINTRDIFSVMMGATDEVALRLANPLRLLLKHLTPECRRGEQHLREMHAAMRALLEDIKARGPPADEDKSIAAHLLRIRDPQTGLPLSDEQLAGEMGLFFFAGFETTGHSMAWTLFCLAQNPEVEARVCAELDALGLLATPSRPRPRQLEYRDLSGLKYLGMVIKEAMRFIPVSGGTMRVSKVPLVLGGYTIPAGVEILLAVHGLMNSVHYWDMPREFLPERWEDPQAEYWPGGQPGSRKQQGAQPAEAGADGFVLMEDEEALQVDEARPPKRFLPFSAGARNCIGQNLAKMNFTATMAVLLSRFTFQLPPELMGPDALWAMYSNRLAMQPKDGLPMRCIPRVSLA